MLSLDFETDVETGEPVCFSWSDGSRAGLMAMNDPRAVEHLGRLLRQPLLCLHNAAFDMYVIRKHIPELKQAVFAAYDEDRIHDTGIHDKLWCIATGDPRARAFGDDDEEGKVMYSLKDLALLHLGVSMNKGEDTWRLRYGELKDIPVEQWPEEAVSYSKDDALLTWRVADYQRKNQKKNVYCQSEVVRTHFALYITQNNALYTDPKSVNAFEAKLKAEYDSLVPDVLALGFIQWDKKNNRYKRNVKFTQDFVRANVPNYVLTKPQKNRTSTKPFVPQVSLAKEDVALYDHPALEKFSRLGALQTQLGDGETTGKIAELRAGGTHRIVCFYDPIKVTGRTGAKQPNVQNFSRGSGIRSCIVAPPGQCIVGADFSNLELHALAEVCLLLFGRSRLAEAFWAGKCVHDDMASAIRCTTYDNQHAERKAKDPEAKKSRQFGKIPNFGYPGGQGPDSLVRFARRNGIKIDRAFAERLKALWLAKWTEMPSYFAYIDRLINPKTKRGTVRGVYDGIVKAGAMFCDACNFMFQNLGARAATRALWLVVRASEVETESPLYGTEPCIFVHDEIHVRCAIEACHEVAQELKRLMELGSGEFLKLVPTEAEPYAMLVWDKEAEAEYDENGRLIPCKK